ncbi:TolC family protein [Pontibacter sp. CAU 1760]
MNKASKKLLLLLMLSCAGATGAMAQQQDSSGDVVWTLEEAVRYAREHNLQVQQSQNAQRLNRVDLREQRMSRLPSLNAGGSYTYNTGSFQDPVTFQLITQEAKTGNYQVSASVPLFMGFQQLNLIKQTELELQASQQDVLSAQNDITLQIITSYLNILFAGELIKISEMTRTLTQEQLERTRILFEAGSVAQNSVLDLESQLAADDLELINAQNQRDISRLSLMQLLNLPASAPFVVEVPNIPEPDEAPALINSDQVFDVAAQTLPSIKAADLRLMSAEKAIDVAQGSYSPRLSLNAGISTRYSSTNQFLVGRELIDNGLQRRELGFNNADGTDPIVVYVPSAFEMPVYTDYHFLDQLQDNIYKQVGLSLQVPIFNGLQARSNVQRAKIRQQNARVNAELARNNLRQTIEQAYVDAVAAQRRYMAAKEQLRAAEKNYENAELRLNAGVINTSEFNIVANTYRSAQSNLLQAKYEYTFKLKVLDFYQGKDISL